MKIIITEPELTQIVRNHVLSTVQLHNGANIQIDFSATRGADGVTASIDIPYVGVTGLDLSPQTQQTKTEEAIPPGTVKAEKVEKAAKTKAASPAPEDAPKGIFADAKAEADAAVAGTAVAEEAAASDTAAAAEGSAQTDAAPAPTADAGVSLFP